MRVLLFGPNGQVGWELQRALAPLGDLQLRPSEAADFSRPASLAKVVRDARPDVIVNAAAYTAVDKAEADATTAQAVNGEAPGVLARAAAEGGAWLVHYSTDYVFDGSGHQPRAETATTGPLSVYGRSKLDGEAAIRASGCQHLIFRTSWVYAARGGNFARTMLRLAAERDRLTVIDDQIGAPTGADLLADITAHAVRSAIGEPALSGTYHAVAGGETSWHGYARFVVEWARAAGVAIRVPTECIEPVPTTAFPTPARRPLNSRLDTTKLQAAFGLHLPHWQSGVQRLLHEVLDR